MRVGAGILVMCVAWLGVARADEPLGPGEFEQVMVLGDVEKTAERFEAYARAHGTEKDARRALERAIELRMLLRQSVDADVALYLRLFRESDPLDAELMELRHARYVIKLRPIPGALNRADTVLARLSASDEEVVRWPAMVLRAERAKDRKRALGLYRQVTKEHRGRKISDARAAEAMGRAIYEVAAARFDKLDVRTPLLQLTPAGHVPPVPDLESWVRTKSKEVKRLARGFSALDKLGPHAGAWKARGDAFVAGQWRRLINETRLVPYPRSWDQDGFVPGVDPPLMWAELRSTFLAMVDAGTEELRDETMAAHERCVDSGLATQTFEAVDACLYYLETHAPSTWRSPELAPLTLYQTTAPRAESIAR